jgi:hypothetical protein
MEQARQLELAWAAGFFDGEGCTMVKRKRGNAAVNLIVAQKTPEMLERFQAAVGGGYIYHNPRAQGAPYNWQATSQPVARQVLDLLWPYLGSIKQAQAERCFAQSTWHDGHRSQLRCQDPAHEVVERASGGRRCRTCEREAQAEYRRKRRLARGYVRGPYRNSPPAAVG